MTPVQLSKSPIIPPRLSPAQSKAVSPPGAPKVQSTVPATTAQDLFNDVISGRITGGALSHLESSAPQPTLLFGSELSHIPGQGQNIWSASREEQSLKFTSQPNQTYQARQYTGSAAPDMSQSIWSASYSNGTQHPHHNLIGGIPSSVSAYQTSTPITHQRVPSASVAGSLHFSSLHHGHRDSFPYSPSVLPEHMHTGHDLVSNGYMNPPLTHSDGSGMYYQNALLPGHHSRHLSIHDPRLPQPMAPPPMWGNTG